MCSFVYGSINKHNHDKLAGILYSPTKAFHCLIYVDYLMLVVLLYVLCHAMPRHTMPRTRAIPCLDTVPRPSAMAWHAMPRHTGPRRLVLCHAMPRHTMPRTSAILCLDTVPRPSAMACHAMPCLDTRGLGLVLWHAMPRHTGPRRLVLWHGMPRHTGPRPSAMPCHA